MKLELATDNAVRHLPRWLRNALAPVQLDEADGTTAVEAWPRLKDYFAAHHDSVIRVIVADYPSETLVVPRGAGR